MTTARMVLINKKATGDMRAFDLPLAYMYQEKFNQPIFGANFLSGKHSLYKSLGKSKPLFNLLPGEISFKIWFMKGGCGKFLHCLKAVLEQIRANRSRGPQNEFINSVRNGTFMQEVAYFDPNDPSIVYVQQPEARSTTSNSLTGKKAAIIKRSSTTCSRSSSIWNELTRNGRSCNECSFTKTCPTCQLTSSPIWYSSNTFHYIPTYPKSWAKRWSSSIWLCNESYWASFPSYLISISSTI